MLYVPIPEVKLPLNSRDELPPILLGLQWIFTEDELRDTILKIIGDEVSHGKKRTGRHGMNYWQILVLGTIRLGLNADFDRVEDMANHHILIRQIMGVEGIDGVGKKFSHQSIKDNLTYFTDDMLTKINMLVVKHGHEKIFLLKANEGLSIKTDSYAFETNVHFPSDMKLLWDAARTCIRLIVNVIDKYNIIGWRKCKDWFDRIKIQERRTTRVVYLGGKNKEKREKKEVEEYLRLCRELDKKVCDTILYIIEHGGETAKLLYFQEMLNKHIDLVNRRLLLKETIPHHEKIHSVFENYTEWLQKGKAGKKVELGLKHLISTDQFDLIVDYKIMEKIQDVDETIAVADRLLDKYRISGISYDKGFSKVGYRDLLELYIPEVALCKKGKLTKEEAKNQNREEFKALRKRHAAVESNINCLENHGLDRCPDKGIDAFKRYAGLGVLAYNLHKIGNEINRKLKKQASKLGMAA
jgi:hypothetical protein